MNIRTTILAGVGVALIVIVGVSVGVSVAGQDDKPVRTVTVQRDVENTLFYKTFTSMDTEMIDQVCDDYHSELREELLTHMKNNTSFTEENLVSVFETVCG